MPAFKSNVFINAVIFAVIALMLAASRWIPHPPNFTPLLAVAIFAGAKASNRWVAYLLPIVALVIGDLKLGAHDLMPVVAIGLLISTFIGSLAGKVIESKPVSGRVMGWAAAGFVASLVFFVITNFAVWASSPVTGHELGAYPHTNSGLVSCFFMALPFFHNQVLSTWLFSGVLFGAYQIAAVRRTVRRA